MTWLAKTPLAVVNAHAEMLERLTAEEALSGVVVIGVGRGLKMRRHKIQSHLNRWERATRRQTRGRSAKPATPTDLKALGIGMRTVERGNG